MKWYLRFYKGALSHYTEYLSSTECNVQRLNQYEILVTGIVPEEPPGKIEFVVYGEYKNGSNITNVIIEPKIDLGCQNSEDEISFICTLPELPFVARSIQ